MQYSAHITDKITGKTIIGPIRSTPQNAIKIAIKTANPYIGDGPKRGDVYEHKTVIHKGIVTNEEAVADLGPGRDYDHYNRYSQNGALFLTAHGEDNEDLIDQVKDLMSRNRRRYT